MSSPFPLQRLPFLALDKVVSHFKMTEILHLSICSRKTSSLIKRWTKRMEIKLKIKYDDLRKKMILKMGETFVQLDLIIPPCSQGPENAHDWKFGSYHDMIFMQKLLWTSSVKDSVAFNTILDFLVENFNVKGISFDFGYVDPQEAYRVLEHANCKGLKLESINWEIIFTPHEVLRNVLKIGASEYLSIQTYVFDTFHLGPQVFKNLSTNRLRLRANWPTLKHIIALKKVPNIQLGSLKLSDTELNTILKKWISGALDFDTMKLSLTRGSVKMDQVMDGTDAEAMPVQRVRNRESFLIRKADGTSEAIVTIDRCRLDLKRR